MTSDNPTTPSEDMAEKRRHPRTPISSKIRISHESFGSIVVRTRDVSSGGVFLLLEEIPNLPLGTVVEGQIQDDMPDRPVVQMEIVRVDAEGFGLRFLD